MGTGSAGSEGSGYAGSGGGVGAISKGRYRGGSLVMKIARPMAVSAAVSKELSRRATTQHFEQQFTNPLLVAVYDDLSLIARQNYFGDPTSDLFAHLQVDPGGGFMPRLAHAIVDAQSPLLNDRRAREIATSSVEGVFCRLIHDDLDKFLVATRVEIADSYDPIAGSSLLGYFLSDLIYRVIVREVLEHLPPEATHLLQGETRRRADRVIDAYRAMGTANSEPRYRDFFRYVSSHPQWMLKEIAK